MIPAVDPGSGEHQLTKEATARGLYGTDER